MIKSQVCSRAKPSQSVRTSEDVYVTFLLQEIDEEVQAVGEEYIVESGGSSIVLSVRLTREIAQNKLDLLMTQIICNVLVEVL